MHLHFSIGGYDYRRTARFRQSIHFSITQVLFMCIDAPERQQILFPQVEGLMAQANTKFPKVRRMLIYFSPLIVGSLRPASTLLHGHIALAILSRPETDPQIVELGLRWWGSPWANHSKRFCSVLKQSSHRVLQNSAFEFLLQSTNMLDHPLNQPTPLLWSIA